MRFLVISKNKHLVPPEVLPTVVDAMSEWINRYNDKLEQVWGFSGIQGGGGIIRVESLDELDAILSEFPMGPFAEQEIYPLVELGDSLQRVKRAAQGMTAVGSK